MSTNGSDCWGPLEDDIEDTVTAVPLLQILPEASLLPSLPQPNQLTKKRLRQHDQAQFDLRAAVGIGKELQNVKI